MPVEPRPGGPLVSVVPAIALVAAVLALCGRSDRPARPESTLQEEELLAADDQVPADLKLVAGPDIRPLPPRSDEERTASSEPPSFITDADSVGPQLVPAVNEPKGLPEESSEDSADEPLEVPADLAHGDVLPEHQSAGEPSPADIAGPRFSLSPSRAFEVEEFDDDALVASNTAADDVLAYFPAEDQLSSQLRPRVQAAFTLARNGALHAARFRFEELLAELAQAKDASRMTSRHRRALAAGLRALEEADDFMVTGTEREIDTRSLAAGHQTPMLHERGDKWTLPHEAMAMYHVYAEKKLAAAVAEEPAGSMVLFGLGKIYAQLSERDGLDQAKRKSLTLYRASLAAHQQNHLAANEAGVLLARAGRYQQAEVLLQRSAQLGRSSVTYRNLAHVHEKLGDLQQAEHHRQLAEQIASQEVAHGQLSAEHGIVWLTPDEFNRRGRGGESGVAVAQRPTEPIAAPPATTTETSANVVAAPPQPTGRAPKAETQKPETEPPAAEPRQSPRPALWW